MVHLAKQFFKHCWRHATYVFSDIPASDSEITPQEGELLNLLVQRATDEQAGVRTAQRGWAR
ncbi:hypothetical protein [Kribbella voronezhensis]|uniref:hypothetical protein n=1 Tax=Kribbella voronezhensis TaxID=2512212 RepID=UPI0014170484|nr:hypothetical protein [Kribbella voronezhensis]